MLAFINIIYYTYYCPIPPKQHGRQWSLVQPISADEGGPLNRLEGRENKICICISPITSGDFPTLPSLKHLVMNPNVIITRQRKLRH